MVGIKKVKLRNQRDNASIGTIGDDTRRSDNSSAAVTSTDDGKEHGKSAGGRVQIFAARKELSFRRRGESVSEATGLSHSTSNSLSYIAARKGPMEAPLGPPLQTRTRSHSVGSSASLGFSVGSAERQTGLAERRKMYQLHCGMFRAHQSGLALTGHASAASASAKSLLRRDGIFRRRSRSYIANVSGRELFGLEGSSGAGVGDNGATHPPLGASNSSSSGRASSFANSAARRSAFLHATDMASLVSKSTFDLLERGGPMRRLGEDDVFCRQHEEEGIFRRQHEGDIFRGDVVIHPGKEDEQSISTLETSGVSGNTDIARLALPGLASVAEPSKPLNRSASAGSRVTFQNGKEVASRMLFKEKTEETTNEDPLLLLPQAPKHPDGTTARRKLTQRVYRRGSSSWQISPGGPTPQGNLSCPQRWHSRSGGRIPMRPSVSNAESWRYTRSESGTSVASMPLLRLRHAHRLESESSGSLEESERSAPRIRHARPLRSESNMSLAESEMPRHIIKHAHPVRSESNTSLEESEMSIPMIKHAHPLRSESGISLAESDMLAINLLLNETSLPSFRSEQSLEEGRGRSLSPIVKRSESSICSPPLSPVMGSRPLSPKSFTVGSPVQSSIVGPSLDRATPAKSKPVQMFDAVTPKIDNTWSGVPPNPPKPLWVAPVAPIGHLGSPSPQQLGRFRVHRRPPGEYKDPTNIYCPKPMLMQRASTNTIDGAGIEVSQISSNTMSELELMENTILNGSIESMGGGKSVPNNKNIFGIVAAPDTSVQNGDINTSWFGLSVVSTIGFPTGASFDSCIETSVMRNNLIGDDMIDNELKRSLSDGLLHESWNQFGSDMKLTGDEDGEQSWDLSSETDSVAQLDPWNVLKDDYAIGYGGGGTLPFHILGVSGDDVNARPHVLSPPLIESLQCFLPDVVSEDNFWMKYSMVRDGASFHTLLQKIRGAHHTIMAIETLDGEVFGSFTSSNWRKNWSYFGTGESFLWKMRESRKKVCHSIIDQAQLESEIDVYPWTGENMSIQLCKNNKIAVGGGTIKKEGTDGIVDPDSKASDLCTGAIDRKSSWEETNSSFGFGLAIDSDMLHGISSPCLTYGSPPLSKAHPDGSPFEILNMEVWTLTPCVSEKEAESLEMRHLFFQGNKL